MPAPFGHACGARARWPATAEATASRGPRKHEEEGIALGVDLVATILGEDHAQGLPVLGQHVCVARRGVGAVPSSLGCHLRGA